MPPFRGKTRYATDKERGKLLLIIPHTRAHLEIFPERAALEEAALAAHIDALAREVLIMRELAQAIDAYA